MKQRTFALDAAELLHFEDALQRASSRKDGALTVLLEASKRLLKATRACACVYDREERALREVGQCSDWVSDQALLAKSGHHPVLQTRAENGAVRAMFRVNVDGQRWAVFAFEWPEVPPFLNVETLRWLASRVGTWFTYDQRDREARTDGVIMRMFADLGRYYAGGHTFQDVLRAFGRVVREHLGLRHVCIGLVRDDGSGDWLVRRGKLALVPENEWEQVLTAHPSSQAYRLSPGLSDLGHTWILPLPALEAGKRFFAFVESRRDYDWNRLARWIQLHASVVVRQRAERQREESRAAQLRALSRVSTFLDHSSGGVQVLQDTLAETKRALNARAVWLHFERSSLAGNVRAQRSIAVGRSAISAEQRLQALAAMRRGGQTALSLEARDQNGSPRAVLIRGLQYAGSVRGLLGIEWVGQVRSAAESFLDELVEQLSLLLQDVEELEQIRRRHRELVVANRVGSLATKLEDPAHALQKALTLFVDASGYTGAVLYQVAEDGQNLEFLASAGRWAGRRPGRIPLPENPAEINRDKRVRRRLRVSARGTVMPLRAYGRLVGLLAAEAREADVVLVGQAGLDTVARELALALENARLIQRLNRTLRLQTTLLQLSRALLDARDLDTILEAIGTAVSTLYPTSWMAMAVRDERTNLLRPYDKIWRNGNVIWSGKTAGGGRRLRSWNKRLQEIESRDAVNGAHLATGREVAGLKNMWVGAPRARGLWVVPCRVYGETQAYMLFGLQQGEVPTAEQVRYMLVGARHVAMAINAALDLRRHQEEARRAAVLAELGRLTGANLSAEDLSQKALEALKRVVPYDLASVTSVELRTKSLKVLAIAGSKPLHVRPGDVVEAANSYLGRVVRSRRPRIIGNLRLSRRRSKVEQRILAYGVRSAVNIPLIAQNKVLGSLNLGSFEPAYFTAHDLPFLNEVAAQLSLAIANRRLFDGLSASLTFSRRLLRTWRFFSREDNPEKLVRYAMVQAIRAFGAAGAFWVRERSGRRCVRHMGLAKHGIRESDILASLEGAHRGGICRTASVHALGGTFQVCFATVSVPTIESRNTLAVAFEGRVPVNEAAAQNFLWTLTSQLVAAVERARFVSTLRKSEENYRALFQNLPVALVLTDESGRIRLANRQASDLLGLPAEELESGRRFDEFIAPEELNQWFQAAHELGGGEVSSAELNLVRADGRRLRVRATRQSVREPMRGELFGLIDITVQRELEKRAAEAEKLAAVGELAAAIAHEIRNPLAAISTSVTALAEALEVSGEDRELMEIVLEESRRVGRVLDDFLRFSRLPRPRKARTSLNALVQEVLRLYRFELPEHVRVETALYDGLPEVSVDSQLLKHVLVNLLQNAVDAVKKQSDAVVRISSGVYTEEGGERQVWVAVADNGPGIPEEIRRKIFQPFFTTKSTGVGMGLPISDGIVRAHGGRMVVRSDGERGTEVRVYLPLEEREAAAEVSLSLPSDR